MNYHRKKAALVDKVACFILAGGEGTRLFPLTKKKCKPAVTFGGHYRLIDVPISNSLNAKLSHIFVVSQHFSSDLNRYIRKTYPLDTFQGAHIELLTPSDTPKKSWYKGTADAIRKNIDHLESSSIEYVLILSGDQLYNMDLEAMVQFAKEKKANLVIASLVVEKTDAKRMGLLKIDSDEKIVDFYEKPTTNSLLQKFEVDAKTLHEKKITTESPSYLGSMGIYVFKKEVLLSILKEDTGDDFGKHIIPHQIEKGGCFSYIYNGYWEDIGTVQSYYDANLALTTNTLGLNLNNEDSPIYSNHPMLPSPRFINTYVKDSIIGDGSIIEAKEVNHSLLGPRCLVGKNSIIRDSIIIGNEKGDDLLQKEKYGIGKNCMIEKAIIDENTLIGDNVSLTNKQNLQKYDGDGVYVRDGIIIVTSGTKLANGFTL